MLDEVSTFSLVTYPFTKQAPCSNTRISFEDTKILRIVHDIAIPELPRHSNASTIHAWLADSRQGVAWVEAYVRPREGVAVCLDLASDPPA